MCVAGQISSNAEPNRVKRGRRVYGVFRPAVETFDNLCAGLVLSSREATVLSLQYKQAVQITTRARRACGACSQKWRMDEWLFMMLL